MNSGQKAVLVIASMIAAVMLLFPPFEFIGRDGLINHAGFSFMFDRPSRQGHGASVNASQLLVQWAFLWSIAVALFFAMRRK